MLLAMLSCFLPESAQAKNNGDSESQNTSTAISDYMEETGKQTIPGVGDIDTETGQVVKKTDNVKKESTASYPGYRMLMIYFKRARKWATIVVVADVLFTLLTSMLSTDEKLISTMRNIAKGVIATWIMILIAPPIVNWGLQNILGITDPGNSFQ